MLVPQLHQLLHLENRETRQGNRILPRIQHPPRVLALIQRQDGTNIRRLNQCGQIREGAHMRRPRSQQLQRPTDFLAHPKVSLDPVQLTEHLHIVGCPRPLRSTIHACKRTQTNRLPGILRHEPIVIAARRFARDEHRLTFLERKHLGIWVTKMLQGHQPEQCRFTCTRWSDHQRMPDIPLVQHHPERRSSIGSPVKQRRR